MSLAELYLEESPLTFFGAPKRKGAAFKIVGVPFDSTASYRPGQRFAPRAIREASLNIEGNAYAIDGDIDEVPLVDLGDVSPVHGDPSATVERVAAVVKEIASEGAIPVTVGGEHTVTLGAVKGLVRAGIRPCMLVLDAHFDLRDEYLGLRVSHATVMRRILEEASVRLFYVGVRAYDKGEIGLASEAHNIEFVTSWNYNILGAANAAVKARSHLSECRHIYLSIDMDVYDPAFAPGVGNPEPGGLSPHDVLPLVARLASDERIVGIDIVEVSPPSDVGEITSILAAKTLQQAIIAAWSSQRRRRKR